MLAITLGSPFALDTPALGVKGSRHCSYPDKQYPCTTQLHLCKAHGICFFAVCKHQHCMTLQHAMFHANPHTWWMCTSHNINSLHVSIVALTCYSCTHQAWLYFGVSKHLWLLASTHLCCASTLSQNVGVLMLQEASQQVRELQKQNKALVAELERLQRVKDARIAQLEQVSINCCCICLISLPSPLL